MARAFADDWILRQKIALACRVLAEEQLVHEALGHISARSSDGVGVWVRCRGRVERGVRHTRRGQIRRVGIDMKGRNAGHGYSVPLEFPIHTQLLLARPDVNAVVHVHPKYVVLCAAAEVPLRPMYGSFDWSGVDLLDEGIATYPSARLISTRSTGDELAAVMGTGSVCIMRGHGATVVGETVEAAVLTAIRLERLAWFCWELHRGAPGMGEISSADLDWYREMRSTVRGTGKVGAWLSYVNGQERMVSRMVRTMAETLLVEGPSRASRS